MPTIARAQGTFGRHMAQYHFDTLLESVDAATVAGQKTLPRLRSCACQASAAWLTALPIAPALGLKDAEFRTAMQHRLGMSPLPHNMVGIRCACAAVPSADNSDHAMTCTCVKGKATMRHDILKGICAGPSTVQELRPRWSRHCAGCRAWRPGPMVLRGGQRRHA
jgi:hypothetical protein